MSTSLWVCLFVLVGREPPLPGYHDTPSPTSIFESWVSLLRKKRTIRKPEFTSKTSFCRDINFFYPKDILFKRLTKRLNQAYDDQLSEGREFLRWEWHILVSMSFFLHMFFCLKLKRSGSYGHGNTRKLEVSNILTSRFVISGCLNIFRKTTITSLFGKRLYNLYIVYLYAVFDRITFHMPHRS